MSYEALDAMTVTTPTARVSEREFQEQVIALLRARKWLYYHTHDARHSVAGFPDLVAVRGDRLLFLELKSERGRPTQAQDTWLDALEATGKAEVFVVYPSGWEKLEEVLR